MFSSNSKHFIYSFYSKIEYKIKFLFCRLTVLEHLIFYASLKTGKKIESKKEIDKMIDDLGLSHKRDEMSQYLSGGMKRKLSIGAAFIGNSK